MSTKIMPLFFALLAVTSCAKKPPAAPRTVPVSVGKAIEKAAPIFVEALGHVEPIITVQVRSRIEGELMEVYFTEGKEVKKNDLLFTIDPRPYEASLKAAQATLEDSLAQLALAEEKVKRYAQLTRDEYYSQIDYETLQANYASAQATVQKNQADVDTAAINLEYCWIYSPCDGLTGILQVTRGNLIGVDQPQELITINQMAPIYVSFSIPENKLVCVRKAHAKKPLAVFSTFEDFKECEFEGKLQMFDNMVDQATGMITLRATYENEDRSLWPGQFVRTRIVTDTVEKAVLIPTTAIQQTQTGPIVYVVKPDNTVEIRKVALGQREDDNIIVKSGITPGETVVLEGQLNLFAGAKVTIPGTGT
jgi:multidrug efflux system membrane fusion protein